MHGSGHRGISLLLYSPFVYGLIQIDTGYMIYALLGAFLLYGLSDLPDKDLDLQSMGLPIKHRGITHTVWFAMLVGFFVSLTLIGIFYGIMQIGIPVTQNTLLTSIGYFGFIGWFSVISHILGDAITPMGVKPFRPISNQSYSLNLVRAGNKTANYLFEGAGTIAITASFIASDPQLQNFVTSFL